MNISSETMQPSIYDFNEISYLNTLLDNCFSIGCEEKDKPKIDCAYARLYDLVTTNSAFFDPIYTSYQVLNIYHKIIIDPLYMRDVKNLIAYIELNK